MSQNAQNGTAQIVPPKEPPRRVKVYELKDNDWHDRGTGFCIGLYVDDIPQIHVRSEESNDQLLLQTKIQPEDGYQKQQETLIVWTEQSTGVDMALSFQEPEGCAAIWEFVNAIQTSMLHHVNDLLDETTDLSFPSIDLPNPDLGSLELIEEKVRIASNSTNGRDALAKYIINESYLSRLLPLLETAEDLESLQDLHRLCNILKMIILLNDNLIIEYLVVDEAIMDVVGILEYDPDFPSHKANHRQYLSDLSKFKEIVRFDNPAIRQKIHCTYRLQYLKDVVLARILDDPTFSILNSLIFFNHVDILSHIQQTPGYLKELFGIINGEEADAAKKKSAVMFLQQCCSIAKNLQAMSRSTLYTSFLQHGMFEVIEYALTRDDPTVRLAGMDILMAFIDHEPLWMRGLIGKQLQEKKKPLTDTLIDLLLSERDLGIKALIADAIKVLLDPATGTQGGEPGAGNMKASDFSYFQTRARRENSETENFLQSFYDTSARKLFLPLMDLDKRDFSKALSVPEVSLYTHLVDILCFFVRQHMFRSKFFILSENLPTKISLLLRAPEKQLKLAALKFFRTCIGLQDEFYIRQMIKCALFEPILNIVVETMPRDNLLNSAALEFFDYIRRQSVKPAIIHIVESYRERLEEIKYVDLFETLILRYEQMHEAVQMQQNNASEEEARRSLTNGNRRWTGPRDLDAEEEEYFNTSDEEDSRSQESTSTVSTKPLVDYTDDEEMAPSSPKNDEEQAERPETPTPGSFSGRRSRTPPTPRTSPDPAKPPPPEKRRREEDDDDELGRLARGKKRSVSVSSSTTVSSTTTIASSTSSTQTWTGRKRSSNTPASSAPPTKKIAISLKTNSPSKMVMTSTPSPTTPTSTATLGSTDEVEDDADKEGATEVGESDGASEAVAEDEKKEEEGDEIKEEERCDGEEKTNSEKIVDRPQALAKEIPVEDDDGRGATDGADASSTA